MDFLSDLDSPGEFEEMDWAMVPADDDLSDVDWAHGTHVTPLHQPKLTRWKASFTRPDLRLTKNPKWHKVRKAGSRQRIVYEKRRNYDSYREEFVYLFQTGSTEILEILCMLPNLLFLLTAIPELLPYALVNVEARKMLYIGTTYCTVKGKHPTKPGLLRVVVRSPTKYYGQRYKETYIPTHLFSLAQAMPAFLWNLSDLSFRFGNNGSALKNNAGLPLMIAKSVLYNAKRFNFMPANFRTIFTDDLIRILTSIKRKKKSGDGDTSSSSSSSSSSSTSTSTALSSTSLSSTSLSSSPPPSLTSPPSQQLTVPSVPFNTSDNEAHTNTNTAPSSNSSTIQNASQIVNSTDPSSSPATNGTEPPSDPATSSMEPAASLATDTTEAHPSAATAVAGMDTQPVDESETGALSDNGIILTPASSPKLTSTKHKDKGKHKHTDDEASEQTRLASALTAIKKNPFVKLLAELPAFKNVIFSYRSTTTETSFGLQTSHCPLVPLSITEYYLQSKKPEKFVKALWCEIMLHNTTTFETCFLPHRAVTEKFFTLGMELVEGDTVTLRYSKEIEKNFRLIQETAKKKGKKLKLLTARKWFDKPWDRDVIAYTPAELSRTFVDALLGTHTIHPSVIEIASELLLQRDEETLECFKQVRTDVTTKTDFDRLGRLLQQGVLPEDYVVKLFETPRRSSSTDEGSSVFIAEIFFKNILPLLSTECITESSKRNSFLALLNRSTSFRGKLSNMLLTHQHDSKKAKDLIMEVDDSSSGSESASSDQPTPQPPRKRRRND
eukprot:NODE_74_length_2484_cov_45.535426_g53_i0.p1 GENE.NODE_74_length_2484_cov_45.535426_g53_i0~~NODE_74_length_2484_cov_45.535426_g53_i0.p1  ORF type:complete len:781 (+),score=116.80 NODE_74_length_2484_cov_45.535426_g53_i0:90-2432(+)